ncbi:hypothetical protein Clacol_010149 [Clathrus columnatus]|uniref:Uncharacterized protein n=1 Tax=Clathrus columnatus TaxID=1419009 RepID=A0AAV5AMJ7_9AGAM|nr:hypothetical protein Clacol_010149 [Clathrus columnatus]
MTFFWHIKLLTFLLYLYGTFAQATEDDIQSAMLSSIRTSWEQGTAMAAIIQKENTQYSLFAPMPFKNQGPPIETLRAALSAVVRQGSDGRLSQQIGDGTDGAALDGASSGYGVLIGTYTDPDRQSFWQDAADKQLNFLLNVAPRTSTGAISHRLDQKQADGVFVGFPYIAAYGAVTSNLTMLNEAYVQCELYRSALIHPGPTGQLWSHIRNDDGSYVDEGLWATGNAWAALGMLHVQQTLVKSSFASHFQAEVQNLTLWIKEVLDGTFAAIGSDNLIPDYIQGGATFGDASASAALASVAFRVAALNPSVFGKTYTDTASKLYNAVLGGINDLGVVSPVVDPLSWSQTGLLSTEAQAFAIMMIEAHDTWSSGTNMRVTITFTNPGFENSAEMAGKDARIPISISQGGLTK